jgi:hypothetical protein
LESFSTEEGIQIDESDEQQQNASDSMQDTWLPDSKITVNICLHSAKHPPPIVSTFLGIINSFAFPKYLFSETQSKSKRKSPQTLK